MIPVGPGNTPRIFMCSGVLLLVRSTTKLSPENSTSVCPFSTPTLDTTQSDTTGYSAVVETQHISGRGYSLYDRTAAESPAFGLSYGGLPAALEIFREQRFRSAGRRARRGRGRNFQGVGSRRNRGQHRRRRRGRHPQLPVAAPSRGQLRAQGA